MQVKTLDIYIFIEGTLFFSSVDNLSLASCDSAFVVGHWLATGWPLVGHWAISSGLSRGLVNFQNGESRDNLVICERRGTVPGDKATEAFEWLINHFVKRRILFYALTHQLH